MARLIDAEPILMKWNTESLGRKEMYDMVKNAPTIDVAPVRHGRWEKNDDLFLDTLYRCSVCGEEFYIENGTGSCNRFALDWIGTDADDFCSMGERKDHE